MWKTILNQGCADGHKSIKMEITKVSQVSGKTHTLEVDVDESQMEDWNNGMLIQDAMPNLSAHMREFLISGVTPEEWDMMFKYDDGN